MNFPLPASRPATLPARAVPIRPPSPPAWPPASRHPPGWPRPTVSAAPPPHYIATGGRAGGGYACIGVGHDIDAVRSLVRRAGVWGQGRESADGLSEDGLRDPAVIRAYTGARDAH